jgi:excisionase family DNA binding protein
VTEVNSEDDVGTDAGSSEAACGLGDGLGVGRGRTLPHGGGKVHRTGPVPVRGDPYVAPVPEAAALLGISKDLAYDLAKRGELPGAFQLGRRWRVSLVKLRAAVHGTEHGPAQHAG